MAAFRLVELQAVGGQRAAWLEDEVLAGLPQRQLEPTVVVLDGEPDRLVTVTLDQVLPPDERTFAEGDGAAHDVVDAAVADDRARARVDAARTAASR